MQSYAGQTNQCFDSEKLNQLQRCKAIQRQIRFGQCIEEKENPPGVFLAKSKLTVYRRLLLQRDGRLAVFVKGLFLKLSDKSFSKTIFSSRDINRAFGFWSEI